MEEANMSNGSSSAMRRRSHGPPAVRVCGGPGDSQANAVVILAESDAEGVAAEYAYLERLCEAEGLECELIGQRLHRSRPRASADWPSAPQEMLEGVGKGEHETRGDGRGGAGPQQVAACGKNEEPEAPGHEVFDVLTVRLKDGNTRDFYFDITSFFGGD